MAPLPDQPPVTLATNPKRTERSTPITVLLADGDEEAEMYIGIGGLILLIIILIILF